MKNVHIHITVSVTDTIVTLPALTAFDRKENDDSFFEGKQVYLVREEEGRTHFRDLL